MLVAKTLEDPLRRVALLPVGCPVFLEYAVDNTRERVQLRPLAETSDTNEPMKSPS